MANTREAELEAALKALLEALPVCDYRFDGTCLDRADWICFDAAGDAVYRCEAHKFVGGMTDDDEPVRRRWAEPAKQAEKLLQG